MSFEGKAKNLIAGLDDPMAFVIFVIMAAIFLYVQTLPGNILNPNNNATFAGYFSQVFNVTVFNPSTSTIGILAITVPLFLFWILRSWATGESE